MLAKTKYGASLVLAVAIISVLYILLHSAAISSTSASSNLVPQVFAPTTTTIFYNAWAIDARVVSGEYTNKIYGTLVSTTGDTAFNAIPKTLPSAFASNDYVVNCYL